MCVWGGECVCGGGMSVCVGGVSVCVWGVSVDKIDWQYIFTHS